MFTIYSADVTGNPGNCSYPHKTIVLDEASLKTAISHDYVCAEYKNNYRNGDNFIGSDCLPVDCDNDHSENPDDWVIPEDVMQAFPGVTFAVHFSRFNNKEKNGKPARPKFHVLFPIDYVSDATLYSDMKKLVNSIFPYFDTQALDNKAVDLEGQQMPKPSKLLSATQKDGKPLVAEEVYIATWEWLAERKCATLVSPQLLERYAMSVARWIQCEEAISDFGFLAKHPTTGNAIQSPYVAMSQNFMSQTNRLWMEIYQIVKENCASEYSGATPMDDAMERLLRARKGN